jgi:hypothetical protein
MARPRAIALVTNAIPALPIAAANIIPPTSATKTAATYVKAGISLFL